MPMVSTMPMMPGSVSVALSSDSTPKIIATLIADRDVGEQAEQAVGQQHEDHDQRGAEIGGELALLDRILAEAGADDALLDRRSAAPAARRRAAGWRDRSRSRTVKLPEICPRAAEDRLADHRRRDHLVVEHDGERTCRHSPASTCGEVARAGGVEAEGDDRLAGALVEAGLRVGQFLARHDDALFDQIGLAVFALRAFERFRTPAAGGLAAPARASS